MEKTRQKEFPVNSFNHHKESDGRNVLNNTVIFHDRPHEDF